MIPSIGFEGQSDNTLFSAPEALLQKAFSKKSDIWSLGCFYYFTQTNIFPFENDAENVTNSILYSELDLGDDLFLNLTMSRNPITRPALEDLIEVLDDPNHDIMKSFFHSDFKYFNMETESLPDSTEHLKRNYMASIRNIKVVFNRNAL
jgi:serine/threonine protein kinase